MGHWLMRELHAERPHADEGMGLVNKEERSSFSLRVTSPVDGKCQKEDSARANLPKWLHGWRLMGQWCGLAQVHTPSQSWLMNHNSASERLGIITSWVRVCLAETRGILLHNWLARSSSGSGLASLCLPLTRLGCTNRVGALPLRFVYILKFARSTHIGWFGLGQLLTTMTTNIIKVTVYFLRRIRYFMWLHVYLCGHALCLEGIPAIV